MAISGLSLDVLTDHEENRWLPKDAIINILCKDGDHRFRHSFPEIFQSKVILSIGKDRVRSADVQGKQVIVFHESVLYRGMFEAASCGGFNNEKVSLLVDTIFMDVLPSLRKHGQYPPPVKTSQSSSKWEAIREIAVQMESIARLGAEHDKRISELEWKTTIMDEQKERDQREIEYLRRGQTALQEQVNEFLGTPDHRTVRLRMMELGIPRTKIERFKLQVGQECKKPCQQMGLHLPEKVVEGRFLVNLYPIEILDAILSDQKLLQE